MTHSRTTLTAWTGLWCGVIAVTLILATIAPWASVTGALLLACVPTGAAVMCWIDSGESAAQAGLTLTISLTVLALASAVMIWTHTWAPDALVGLTIVAIGSCAVRLRRAGR